MTEIESVITLARHYWFNKYSREKSGTSYSNNDYDLFPRYKALKAILKIWYRIKRGKQWIS